MPRLRQLVTSADLEAYFVPTGRDAQEVLPLVVRRLILATTTPGTLGPLRMAAGDDVRLHGWDGQVRLSAEHPYVPAGGSVWEMGVSSDPEDKATGDFKKRTEDPRGVDPSSTTFVFVTPHVWAGKQAWVEDCKRAGTWLDVRVIDGQILSEWFDLAPAAAAWFQAERGAPIYDVDDVEAGWFRVVEEPLGLPVPPALVIGGRTEAAGELRQWLETPAGDFFISAESADEVVAFALAGVKLIAGDKPESDLPGRVLVARAADALHYLGGLQTPHVVIVSEPGAVSQLRAARLRNVHLVVPGAMGAGPNRESSPRSLPLPGLRRSVVQQELIGLGYDQGVADRIARESRGSFQAVLWGMGTRTLHELAWLQEPAASLLAPLVLARRWPVAEHADQKVLERLADRLYREIRGTATEWRRSNGPLQVWGDCWDWKAWRVAWEQLAPHFTPDLVKRFTETAVQVLGTTDPALELPAEDRWMASIQGKVHPNTTALRNGLVDSTAMFGALSDRLRVVDGQSVANSITTQLLDTDQLAGRWLSLAPWLPDFAEAAPERFIAAAERLAGDKEAMSMVFADGGMFGSSPYVHLLWALERLAWNPHLLGRVVLLLGKLAESDPGGSLQNRPRNTLRAILLPWYPGTAASPKQRLEAFDRLGDRHSSAAWECGLALLPSDHDIGSPTAEPRYREWRPAKRKRPSKTEHLAFVAEMVPRLGHMAGIRQERWMQIVAETPMLIRTVPKQATSLIDALRTLDVSSWTPEQFRAMGETVRATIQHHESFPDADWSLDAAGLELLQPIAARFAPTRPEDQHRWLFVSAPDLPYRADRTWEEEKAEIERMRAEAVQAVRGARGLEGLVAWSSDIESPEALGAAVATALLTDHEEQLLLEATLFAALRGDARSHLTRFGEWFSYSRERARGSAWSHQVLREALASKGEDAALAFALALEATRDLWSLLDSLGAGLVARYWSQIRVRFLDLIGSELAVPRLLEANRPFAAIPVVASLIREAPTQKDEAGRDARVATLCRMILRNVPEHSPTDERGAPNLNLLTHNLSQILGFVEKHAEEDGDTTLLAKWEWQWFPALEKSGRGIRTLNGELSRSPDFFVELLKIVYRSKADADRARSGEEEKPSATPSDAEHLRWTHAWKLLEKWSYVPGIDLKTVAARPKRGEQDPPRPIGPAVSGSVDPAKLNEWISGARELAGAADRLGPFERHLGKIFAYAPADPDGTWPCQPVRFSIEMLSNPDVERSFVQEIHSRRGVHSVGRTGAEERQIRDAFNGLASLVEGESPRTASALRAVASDFDAEAKERDRRGTLEEFTDL